MAGTNQAANLSGMLSQIGGTLGRGVDQSVMDKLGGNIERMSKPPLDMTDAESVAATAQWYHDTGKDREAMMMAEKAESLRKEQSAMEAMAIGVEETQKAATAAQGGDVRLVNEQLKNASINLNKAAEAGDAAAVKQYKAQIQELQPLVQAAQGVSNQKQAAGVLEFDKMLSPDFRRMDQQTGQQVPLTDEQRAGIERQRDVMLQNPAVHDGYVKAKVQQDQVRRMEQTQADEGKIATASQNIFAAETEEKVEEVLEAAMKDPDLSPQARSAVVQQVNAQKTYLARKTERLERAAELNAPVITKADYDTLLGSINSMPEDAKAKTRLIKSLESVYNTQKKIDNGGVGFASKSARERLAKSLNQIDQQVIAFEAADMAAKRQLKQQDDNRKQAAYVEAQQKALLGPRTTDVTQYQKAMSDEGNELTYPEAKEVLQRELNQKVESVRPLLAPEEQAIIDARVAEDLPKDIELTEAQADLLKQVRRRYPDLTDKKIIKGLKAQGKWEAPAPTPTNKGPLPIGALPPERNTGRVGAFIGDMVDNFFTPGRPLTPAEADEQARLKAEQARRNN